MSDKANTTKLTPTLARMILEQIERVAAEQGISLDTTQLVLPQEQMTYKHTYIPDGYGSSHTSQPTIVGYISPLIVSLQQLKNIPFFSPETSAFELLQRDAVLVDNPQEASRLNKIALQNLRPKYDQVCADEKVQRNLVEAPKADSRAYTLDIQKLRELTEQDIGAGSHLSKAGRLLVERRQAGANREVA